jgi:hypothetical protein
MRMTVFGATGPTGRQILAAGLTDPSACLVHPAEAAVMRGLVWRSA